MRAHPGDEIISRCLMGEASAEDREHLRTCAECRSECERFEGAFAAFRGSIRDWSEVELAAVVPSEAHAGSKRVAGGTWIMAFLLLLALTGLKIALDSDGPQPSPTMTDHDTAFLDYVSKDVERPVPSGMEPLLTLVSR